MFITDLLESISRALQGAFHRWQESRRIARDFAELSEMSEPELRDIGLSHATLARFASKCE